MTAGSSLCGADLLAPVAVCDPYGYLARLRAERGPVVWSERHRAWILSSFAEVFAGFRDPRLSSDRLLVYEERHAEPGDEATARTLALLRGWMVFRDEPDHARLRDPVRRAFTPRAIARLRRQIEGVVDELLDEVLEAGSCDLRATFAFPLPAVVMALLLGVPPADRHRFGTWSRKLAAVVFGASGDPGRHRIAGEGSAEFADYFRWLIAAREREPGDDLVSALLASRDRGDGLTDEELVGACTLLLFAGHETTTTLISNATAALALHPEQAQVLRDDATLWRAAIEEFLRYDGPAKVQVRRVTAPHERAGARLAEGDLVYLAIAGANHDPAEFPDPDRVDVRRNASTHLGFGAGPHFCLGAQLARLEAEIALRALVERSSSIDLGGELAWEPVIVARSLTALPVVIRPART